MNLTKIYNKIIGKTPLDFPMVQYWKTKNSVEAKVTRSKDGCMIMELNGEEYPFPTFPRGHLLLSNKDGEYTPLSILKHEIKNQIFNDSWWKLEAGIPNKNIIEDIKKTSFNLIKIALLSRYDMLPPERMCPMVREFHRAWTKIAPKSTYPIRDYICFILQEDDAYRFRVQWLVKYFKPNIFNNINIKDFNHAMNMMKNAEIVEDMKLRVNLWRRILMLLLEDENVRYYFIKLCKEMDFKKIGLSEADKYHFRGKYFKVDYDTVEY